MGIAMPISWGSIQTTLPQTTSNVISDTNRSTFCQERYDLIFLDRSGTEKNQRSLFNRIVNGIHSRDFEPSPDVATDHEHLPQPMGKMMQA